jgi:hypothetical protein
MMAHVQQILSTVPLLLFGVLALLVWRRYGTVRRDRAALGWALTAAYFLIAGTYATLHSLLSAAAGATGEGSALYTLVSNWVFSANVTRGILSMAFGGMLLVLMVSRRRWGRRVVATSPAVLAGTAVLASVALRQVPVTSGYTILSSIAIVTAGTAIVMMVALFAAIRSDGLDQLLWLALAVYALKETMTVSFMGVMAAWTMTYAATYYKVFYWVAGALAWCMVGVAARRLQLATGGRPVPAPFERVHALRRPAPG